MSIDLPARLSAAADGLDRPYVLADVGGRWGPQSEWLSVAPGVQIVAFDPDEEECRRLQEADDSGRVRYVPIALGAQAGPATLHLTQDPACASLYPPVHDVVTTYPFLGVAAPVGERTIEVDTLDAWCDREGVTIDAIKLDAQGAELDVLRGAPKQVKSIVMVEVEVEFNPIYGGQPLFGDVDAFLRERGFQLWRFGNMAHYTPGGMNPRVAISDFQAFDSRIVTFTAEGGQAFWADAWFVAGDVLTGSASDDRVRRAAIAAAATGFTDLAAGLLDRVDRAAAA